MTSSMETELWTREPRSLFADLNHLFDDWDVWTFTPFGRAAVGSPLATTSGRGLRLAPTDLVDTGTAFELDVEIPGIPKDKLEVSLRGTHLEIRGEATESKESDQKGWVHRERSYAGFYRAVELPEPVRSTEAKATVKDGVLHLELPKLAPTPSPDEVKVPVQ